MSRAFLASLLLIGTIGGAAAAPKPLWSTQLKVPVYQPPQAQNGSLFLTSTQPSGPNLFALNARTGKILWSFSTQGAIGIPPTVGKSQVFVASDIGDTHYLRAVDAKTGMLIWQYTRNQPPECMCSQASILTGGMLFAQSDGHSLYAFAPSGAAPSKRLWQFPGNGAPLTSPVVAAGLVVFGSGDHDVYALDAKTGAVKWRASTGYVFIANPAVADNVVVIGDQGGNIDAFDLQTGKSLWSVAAGTIDAAAVIADRVAYLVSEDRSIYALSLAGGQQLWQYTMDDYATFAPVLAGDKVIAANRAGQLIAVDAKTGTLAWSADLGGTPFSQPEFWQARNAIVLKIGDHAVGAFDASTGKNLWLHASPLVVTPPVVNGQDVDFVNSAGQVTALD